METAPPHEYSWGRDRRNRKSYHTVLVDASHRKATSKHRAVSAVGIVIIDGSGQCIQMISELAAHLTGDDSTRLEYEAMIRGVIAASVLGLRYIEVVSDNDCAIRRFSQRVRVDGDVRIKADGQTLQFKKVKVRRAVKGEVDSAHALANRVAIAQCRREHTASSALALAHQVP